MDDRLEQLRRGHEQMMRDLPELSPEEMSQAFHLLEVPNYPEPVSPRLETLSAEEWGSLSLALQFLMLELEHSRVH
jgi:hypothetical protein